MHLYLISVGEAFRALVTVVVVDADAPAPLREATGLLVDPVMSSLAFLCVIHGFINYLLNSIILIIELITYLGRAEAGAVGFAALMAVSAADCDRSLCRMVTLAPLPGDALREAAPSAVTLE